MKTEIAQSLKITLKTTVFTENKLIHVMMTRKRIKFRCNHIAVTSWFAGNEILPIPMKEEAWIASTGKPHHFNVENRFHYVNITRVEKTKKWKIFLVSSLRTGKTTVITGHKPIILVARLHLMTLKLHFWHLQSPHSHCLPRKGTTSECLRFKNRGKMWVVRRTYS